MASPEDGHQKSLGPERLPEALGCRPGAIPPILERLGYRYVGDDRYVRRARRRRQKASVAER
jgi:hypothetical protein